MINRSIAKYTFDGQVDAMFFAAKAAKYFFDLCIFMGQFWGVAVTRAPTSMDIKNGSAVCFDPSPEERET